MPLHLFLLLHMPFAYFFLPLIWYFVSLRDWCQLLTPLKAPAQSVRQSWLLFHVLSQCIFPTCTVWWAWSGPHTEDEWGSLPPHLQRRCSPRFVPQQYLILSFIIASTTLLTYSPTHLFVHSLGVNQVLAFFVPSILTSSRDTIAVQFAKG